MTKRIRIGNQTAFSAAEPMAPFEFALAQGFDAFEWFSDKKQCEDGTWSGWGFDDMGQPERARVARTGEEQDVLYTVHAPWQANPLHEQGPELLLESVDFARDIGADLVNLHLYTEQGIEVFLERLAPVVSYAAERGVRIALENTPLTTPADFRDFFAHLSQTEREGAAVGMCLDIGHANLCEQTRNDFIRYLDELGPGVPIVHAHVHENYGDVDSHLPLFTGPAREHDGGIRALVERFEQRGYQGALILEVWPQPPELLSEAERRLRRMLGKHGHKRKGKDGKRTKRSSEVQGRPNGQTAGQTRSRDARPRWPELDALRSGPTPELNSLSDYGAQEDDFTRAVVRANEQNRSWRERLGWVHETLTHADFDPSPERLATLAVYLRFLGTGEVACEEDGRHFRPNHHASAAADIQGVLETTTGADNAWILRKIYPWLPSFADDFRRKEPLTRIRDIAHRNDIPHDLKNEIKHRLQNKLHRCAGPEDFQTSEEILERITTPGASYSPEFVQQFEIFHEELGEFFNASALDVRLRDIRASLDTEQAAQVDRLLALKAKRDRSDQELLALLEALTFTRALIDARSSTTEGAQRQHMRTTDIALEDFAFALLSEAANRFEDAAAAGSWDGLLQVLSLALANVRLSRIEPEETSVLESELAAWSPDLTGGAAKVDRLALLRIKSTLERTERLAEGYTDRVLSLFPGRVTSLGRSLQVAGHAIAVFCEGDIRGNIVFQLSKLVGMLRKGVRAALELSPWETVVPAEAYGLLVEVDTLSALEGRSADEQPVIALVQRAEGDEEIPTGVRGILLGHAIPQLSHLGVRARQAGIPFASADDRQLLQTLKTHLGKSVRLRVGADELSLQKSESPADTLDVASGHVEVELPEVRLTKTPSWIPAVDATSESCGAKAAGAGRLLALAEESGGLFAAPQALALPFGVMEHCLTLTPGLAAEYRALQQRLAEKPDTRLDAVLEDLRALIERVKIPAVLLAAIGDAFGKDTALAVRSSANGEDLEQLAGAGLYDSVIGVRPEESNAAIRKVWASIWTRRATMSRIQARIPHDRIHMAVLVQALVEPELSFVMHTLDPATKDPEIAYVELAVGLGETLASASQPGTPYRLRCNRTTGEASLVNCASFSYALRPGPGGVLARERLDYSDRAVAAHTAGLQNLGARLAAVASMLQERLGCPQDVEGMLTADDRLYIVQTRPQQGI
jgi:phosphoglucan, water dikinase